MPDGTFVVDHAATFAQAVLMGTAPKDKFGSPGVQDVSAEGIPKWLAHVAVTFQPQNGMAPVSDVLRVSITAHGDPAEGMTLPAAVVLDQLRVGVSPPERREGGGIRGGRLWATCTGIRSSLPAGARMKEAS